MCLGFLSEQTDYLKSVFDFPIVYEVALSLSHHMITTNTRNHLNPE